MVVFSLAFETFQNSHYLLSDLLKPVPESQPDMRIGKGLIQLAIRLCQVPKMIISTDFLSQLRLILLG